MWTICNKGKIQNFRLQGKNVFVSKKLHEKLMFYKESIS